MVPKLSSDVPSTSLSATLESQAHRALGVSMTLSSHLNLQKKSLLEALPILLGLPDLGCPFWYPLVWPATFRSPQFFSYALGSPVATAGGLPSLLTPYLYNLPLNAIMACGSHSTKDPFWGSFSTFAYPLVSNSIVQLMGTPTSNLSFGRVPQSPKFFYRSFLAPIHLTLLSPSSCVGSLSTLTPNLFFGAPELWSP